MERAKSVLGDAQKAFSDFAKSVSDSITSSFSFKAAQEAGAETGRGFLASLTDQVAKTRDFAVKINRLLAAGLSEGALQQVLAAGQEAGGAIADELLNGGAAAIAQANALTAEVASLGTNVGQNAAVQFRQAGVDAGTAMVAGITEAISKFQVKLRSKKLTPRQLARLQKDFGVSVDFLLSGGQASIPALADGGIVKASPGGTLALIGEGGRDEAVIPLDRMGSMGGGDVNIYVQGADPNAVVDALRTYMFRNGSVPIRVS
jgi:phosphotransferase system HPr-like phosphotransfer protein